MSREYTTDEVRQQFLDQVMTIVHYWEHDSRTESLHRKLRGVAFSILAAIDGCACGIPAFILAPCPHPSDKPYHQDTGVNWYPENHEVKVNSDIAGSLHELLPDPKEPT